MKSIHFSDFHEFLSLRNKDVERGIYERIEGDKILIRTWDASFVYRDKLPIEDQVSISSGTEIIPTSIVYRHCNRNNIKIQYYEVDVEGDVITTLTRDVVVPSSDVLYGKSDTCLVKYNTDHSFLTHLKYLTDSSGNTITRRLFKNPIEQKHGVPNYYNRLNYVAPNLTKKQLREAQKQLAEILAEEIEREPDRDIKEKLLTGSHASIESKFKLIKSR
jgi:hypothetical protein